MECKFCLRSSPYPLSTIPVPLYFPPFSPLLHLLLSVPQRVNIVVNAMTISLAAWSLLSGSGVAGVIDVWLRKRQVRGGGGKGLLVGLSKGGERDYRINVFLYLLLFCGVFYFFYFTFHCSYVSTDEFLSVSVFLFFSVLLFFSQLVFGVFFYCAENKITNKQKEIGKSLTSTFYDFLIKILDKEKENTEKNNKIHCIILCSLLFYLRISWVVYEYEKKHHSIYYSFSLVLFTFVIRRKIWVEIKTWN